MWQRSIAALLIFTLGACVGSFVALAAYRLPRELSIVRPRSFCTNCHAALTTWQNVPIVSWLILRGRCARCDASIGFRPLLTEVALGAAALWLALNFAPADALARFILCAALMFVAMTDLEWRIFLSSIPLVGIPLGLLCATFLMPDVGWLSSLLGIVCGGGVLFLTGLLYRLIRGREGVAPGDIFLVAMAGAFLGWPGALFTLFFGSMSGAIGGLAIAIPGWSPPEGEPIPASIEEAFGGKIDVDEERELPIGQRPIPFIPFLALAAAVYALFQPQLLDWYLGR